MDYNIQKQSTLTLRLMSGRAIQLGTNEISNPKKTVEPGKGNYYTPESYVYFGTDSGIKSTPIKWRVLNADRANDGKTNGSFCCRKICSAVPQLLTDLKTTATPIKKATRSNCARNSQKNPQNFSAQEQAAMRGRSSLFRLTLIIQ